MADWTAPFRSAYRIMRVSRASGAELELVRGVVVGGSIDRNLDAAVKESGSVTLAGSLDVGSDLVRVYLDATPLSVGSPTSVALGTFLPSVSSRAVGGATASQTVDLAGRLRELSDEQFDETYSLPAGSDPVAAAVDVCEGVGLQVDADPHDTYTTSQLWTFDDSQGGTKLDCVNQLLDMAGFASARTDAMGVVVMRRWRSISDRATSWEYVEGKNARFLRDVTDEYDVSGVANVVKAVFSDQDSVTVGIAENLTGRFGVAEMGRRIYKRYDYNQGATQEQADAKAAQLLEGQSAMRRVTFEAVYAPVDIDDSVRFSYRSQGIDGTFGVRKMTLDLGAGCLTTLEVRSFG